MQKKLRLALILLSLAALSAAAQDLIVDVNLRMLAVSVEDERGHPVLDLTAGDFEVMEKAS